jgi:hypothetical protein
MVTEIVENWFINNVNIEITGGAVGSGSWQTT